MPKRKSIDHATMRDMNLTLILRTLHEQAPLSRMGLANLTKLNKAAISGMVKELMRLRLVHEIGTVETKVAEVGRPAINLALNPNAGVIISVEIGVQHITVVTADFCADILNRQTVPLTESPDPYRTLEQVTEMIKQAIAAVPSEQPVFGVGVGLPGIIDRESDTLLLAPNLHWKQIPIGSFLVNQLDVPVYIDNEANLAALGESYFSHGHRAEVVVYIVGNEGIGGGVMLNGHLLTGDSGYAGEIGHMTIQPDGLACNCGSRGCWETLIGWNAILRRAAPLTEDRTDLLGIEELTHTAQAGNPVALHALHETGYWLGIGIANLINIFNPKRIILGGQFSVAFDILTPSIHDVVSQQALAWSREDCLIMPSNYGQDSCLMGGIAIVHRHVLNHAIDWPD